MSDKIPKGWKWVKLGEVIKIKHGYAFPGENITNQDTGKVLVTPGNFNIGGGFKSNKLKFYSKDYPKEYEFQGGEIIVVMTDLSKDADILGYSAKVPTDKKYKYLHNQRIGLVEIISSHVDKDFIYWLMRTTGYHFFIVGGASGTSVMHTSPDRINEYSFLLPPLPEQKAIAEVLSSIDDKIDLLHRQNKTLEEMAMTLFRQWFIEPAKDGLPEGWEEKALDEIAEFLNGIPSQKYHGDKLPVIKIKEMREGITESSDYCNNNVPEKYLVNSGDILFSWSGSLEVVIWFGSIGVLNQHIFKVTSLEYPKWFCYLSIKQHIEEFRAIAESKTTTMGHIQREHLSNTKVFIPPKIFFENYNKAMTPIFDKIIANNAEIQTLEKLRDTLLPKLMSGEVKIMNNE